MNRRLLLALCGSALAGPAPGGAADPAPVPVFAHYMPWFRAEPLPDGQIEWEHWQWHGRGPKHDPDEIRADGRRDIASVFYPMVGPYDGRDPRLLDYHVLSARAAGLDGFIADWYGPGTHSDNVFGLLLETAERLRFRAAICLEEKSFFPGYAEVRSRGGALDEAERQIRHVLETHAKSPAYARVKDRPLLYLFVNHNHGLLGRHSLTPDELAALRARFDGRAFFLVHGPYDPAYRDVADGLFNWVSDAAARSAFLGDTGLAYAAAAAAPGFDDTGVWGWGNGPRIVDRRGGSTYDEHWTAILARRPDAIQVVTWNDFQEGSTIEPSMEYGFDYLDHTERWVERLNRRPARLKDNAWPYRLFRLRQRIALLPDPAVRGELDRHVSRFTEDWMAGRRFGMAWRLGRLEKAAPAAPEKEKP